MREAHLDIGRISRTRLVNELLHASYTIEQVEEFDDDRVAAITAYAMVLNRK